MAMAIEADNGPIGSLNTTPLIDIMLVLLVMFIVTVPLQTHAVKVNVPPPSKLPKQNFDYNTVGIDAAGQVRWNGQAIDLVTLRSLLERTHAMVPEPELHLASDPQARYARVDEMLAVVKRSGVTKAGFVGNERFARFGK